MESGSKHRVVRANGLCCFTRNHGGSSTFGSWCVARVTPSVRPRRYGNRRLNDPETTAEKICSTSTFQRSFSQKELSKLMQSQFGDLTSKESHCHHMVLALPGGRLSTRGLGTREVHSIHLLFYMLDVLDTVSIWMLCQHVHPCWYSLWLLEKSGTALQKEVFAFTERVNKKGCLRSFERFRCWL